MPLPQAVKSPLSHLAPKVFILFVLTGICLILTCFKAPDLSEVLLPMGLALGGFASLSLMRFKAPTPKKDGHTEAPSETEI